MVHIEDFVRESNAIEGIYRTLQHQIDAHVAFLLEPILTIPVLEELVKKLQPNAVLRDKIGLNVRVGEHRPPPGGPEIRDELESVLQNANANRGKSRLALHSVHMHYETLHPFTDGNGRSGRAIWLWMQDGILQRNFLHDWYYLSLQFGNSRGKGSTRD